MQYDSLPSSLSRGVILSASDPVFPSPASPYRGDIEPDVVLLARRDPLESDVAGLDMGLGGGRWAITGLWPVSGLSEGDVFVMP